MLPPSSRLEAILWRRHANPWSGWSRVPTLGVIVYALYRRDLRLLVAGLVWAAINPFVFSPPDSDAAWMTRAVLAERWWSREEGNGVMGLTYPNVCNTLAVISTAYTLLAAWWRHPLGTVTGLMVAMAAKFWWIGVLVRRYDRSGIDFPVGRIRDKK